MFNSSFLQGWVGDVLVEMSAPVYVVAMVDSATTVYPKESIIVHVQRFIVLKSMILSVEPTIILIQMNV